MDQISAAAAAGDEETVAVLSATANLEDVDRRRRATPLPMPGSLELAAEEIRAELRRKVTRAHARGDVIGEREASERLASFEQRAGLR
jgi:hypothetical protein